MAMLLDTNRTFKEPINTDYGNFTAEFKVLKRDTDFANDKELLGAILVGVDGVELPEGVEMTQSQVVGAIINDAELSKIIAINYYRAIEKKVMKQTSEKPSAT
jgi:hypothetical protein